MNPQLQSKVFDSLVLHLKAERSRSRPSRAGSPAWESLAADLRELGLDKTLADALVSWVNFQAEQSRHAAIKIRILHPMEREFISIEAYDHLLELYRLGLIGPQQLEQVIENCAFLTSLPANKEQVQKMVLRAFTENLEEQGLGSSH